MSVLFLVPSLALMSQTVREWTADTDIPLRSFALCSDTQVGKRRQSNDDVAEIDVLDLAFPATTSAVWLARSASVIVPSKMSVVFATYQSIQERLRRRPSDRGRSPGSRTSFATQHVRSGIQLP